MTADRKILIAQRITGWILLALVVSLIAYGIASYHRPHPVLVPTPVHVTDGAARFPGELAATLADLRQADRDHREAWIADGYSHDLRTLADDGGESGAASFAMDAITYLDAAGNTATAPPPGWQQPYAQIRDGLNTLAARYGLAPAPAPPYVISGAAIPVHPWQPPAGTAAGACTATSTVTNSTSDTGASSASSKTTTKCGTGTASVTHKTSVSAKGKVTHTTTTTTTGPTPGSSPAG